MNNRRLAAELSERTRGHQAARLDFTSCSKQMGQLDV